jgi:modification methylase
MKAFNHGKQLGSVWAIPLCSGQERLKDARGKKLHPTQKPEALLSRILRASTQPGDIVLDPFLGSGTTAAVARQLRRRWLGIERDPVYAAAACARIEAVSPLPLDAIDTAPILEARVPFTRLIEANYLRAGDTLMLDMPTASAVVLADGHVQSNGFVGSIHRVGAHLKQVPSCNGWLHWRYFDTQAGTWRPLDQLRRQWRASRAKAEE